MAPKCGAEVQSGVAKFNRGMLCLTEKIYVLDKLHSLNPMSYRVVGCEFNVSESTILFFKISLNTHKENKGREQLCQGSQVSMRVARGSASWLSSHGRGLGSPYICYLIDTTSL